MKKYVCGGVLLLFLFSGAYAQRGKPVRAMRPIFETQPAKVSVQLQRRAFNSYVKAYQLEKQLDKQTPNLLPRHATPLLISRIPLKNVEAFYPEMAQFLTTKKQLADYFVSRNNREIIKNTKAQHQRYLDLQAHIDQLKEAFQPVGPLDGTQDMEWLAQQITPDTQAVILGEKHGEPIIQARIPYFLRELRLRFPEREIFLLMEFFPDVDEKFGTQEFQKIWEPFIYAEYLYEALEVRQRNIKVAGLENPTYMRTDATALTHLGTLVYWGEDILATPEGMRLRNLSWQNTLKRYRAQHPDALFVVHCGFNHSDYAAPYSIGKFLQSQGKTFSVLLFPGYQPGKKTPQLLRDRLKQRKWFNINQLAPEDYFPDSTFDMVTQGTFPQRVVQFKDANGNNFSDLTGFDVQIKIPIAN